MTATVSFSWPHPAGDVRLAGSFNDWSPAEMSRGDNGLWRLTLDVPTGKHEFKFVVDGNWTHDGEQPHTQNEVGSFNNVLEASAKEESEVNGRQLNGERPKAQIEVERKFMVPPNYREILEANGFSSVKEFEETLSDDYFDTPDFTLMNADHW